MAGGQDPAFTQKVVSLGAGALRRGGREVAAPVTLPPKRPPFCRNPIGLVTRAAFRNEIFQKMITILYDSMNYKKWLPLPSDGLCLRKNC